MSDDPTPQNPIALDLLAAEDSCGIYLARPCSFGLAAADPSCEPLVWTLDRYSERVIESLEGALLEVAPRDRGLVLVGYSGGGLLAAHLANRISRVQGIITLGANLDLGAWVEHHGYLSSIVSRSPAAPFPMRGDLAQLHVFGARDRVSPASISLSFLQRDPRSSELVLESADHTCCWVREWPLIRERFLRQIDETGR
ncbi:MAG: alpha/beta hydrolase, partial [Myxococcales bacterium]|nr:alpha/beta hydrolase [Myxococcales bacterium]